MVKTVWSSNTPFWGTPDWRRGSEESGESQRLRTLPNSSASLRVVPLRSRAFLAALPWRRVFDLRWFSVC